MHKFQVQDIHLRFHGGVSSAGLPNQLSHWAKQELLPAMEEVLDDLELKHHIIRIEQVLLDVGEVVGEDWRHQLIERVCKALRQEIRTAPVTPIPLHRVTTPQSKEAQAAWGDLDIARSFLVSGTLPWYVTNEYYALKPALHQWAATGYFATDDGITFLRLHPRALQRLLFYLDDPDVWQWVYPWVTSAERAIANQLMQLLHQPGSDAVTARLLVFAWIFQYKNAPAFPLGKWLMQQKQLFLKQLSDIDVALQNARLDQPDLTTALEVVIEILSGGEVPVADLAPEGTEQPDSESYPLALYYLPNAGIVLLHPFLPTFLSNLEWVNKNGQWVDVQSQQKAIVLLHYLATGAGEVDEYVLPLCKLLCGWPLSMPLNTSLILTPQIEAACNELLEQVIDHWKILKTTTVQGLQQTFLHREGRLNRNTRGWQLVVEQQAYDILLEHLPWSIGMLRTPWMEEWLYVDWA